MPMQRIPYLRPAAMKRWLCTHLLAMLAIQVICCSTAWSLNKNPQLPKGNGPEGHLLERIDFGNSYIRGQTIQSGAVYLLQRKKSDIESLLKPRENYREEILKDFHVQEENVQPTKMKD